MIEQEKKTLLEGEGVEASHGVSIQFRRYISNISEDSMKFPIGRRNVPCYENENAVGWSLSTVSL